MLLNIDQKNDLSFQILISPWMIDFYGMPNRRKN